MQAISQPGPRDPGRSSRGLDLEGLPEHLLRDIGLGLDGDRPEPEPARDWAPSRFVLTALLVLSAGSM